MKSLNCNCNLYSGDYLHLLSRSKKIHLIILKERDSGNFAT